MSLDFQRFGHRLGIGTHAWPAFAEKVKAAVQATASAVI